MARKAVTVIELIIIGYSLIMGVYVYADRNTVHQTPQYPANKVHIGPLVPPATAIVDTPWQQKKTRVVPLESSEFSASTKRLLDSLITQREKRRPKGGPFLPAEQRLMDSAMAVKSNEFFRSHPASRPRGVQLHGVVVELDSTHIQKSYKAKSHGKHK